MPTIVHFEIPSDDIERSRNFYNELFGWDIEKWTGGGGMGGMGGGYGGGMDME